MWRGQGWPGSGREIIQGTCGFVCSFFFLFSLIVFEIVSLSTPHTAITQKRSLKPAVPGRGFASLRRSVSSFVLVQGMERKSRAEEKPPCFLSRWKRDLLLYSSWKNNQKKITNQNRSGSRSMEAAEAEMPPVHTPRLSSGMGTEICA
jgi:hypothetical protein